MEEKKEKEQNIVGTTTSQEAETNELLTNEEQDTTNVALNSKNTKTGSPSHENATPPYVQWPYTPQHIEQFSLNARPYVPVQSPSPAGANQWQQLLHMQSTAACNQVQQGQPSLHHLPQSTTPFWMQPRPGYQLPGVNVPAAFQAFTPVGTINSSWQAPAVIGATSSSNQPQVPNLCYPVNYSYPGYPGTWDPSSWCAQGQQSQLPCTYASSGGYGYFSSRPPPTPGCSASPGQSFHRGIIKPTAKLSQKHQQLWEAQSAENVQLWTHIGQLQSELADYKSRLAKLEVEVSSLKPAKEEPIAQVTGTVLSGKTSKRGRPRKLPSSVDALLNLDNSYPRARGRKPAALSKVQSPETRTLIFEKVSLNKVEDKEIKCHSPASTQRENDERISSTVNNSNVIMEVNGSNLMKPEFSTLSNKSIGDKAKGVDTKGSSATHIGTAANGSFVWPSDIISENCRRSVLKMNSQGLYDNSSVISQGGKHIPGWSFVAEENASEQIKDAVTGSAKDENEGETADDTSSGGENQASKRARPDVLPNPDISYIRARGRKPATLGKVQSSETKTLSFEKVILNKVEDKETKWQSPAITQQENSEKVSSITTGDRVNMDVNGSNLMMPAFGDKENEGSSAIHFPWPSNIIPERNVSNLGPPPGFYDNNSVIKRGGNHIPGWTFVDEENASEQIKDTIRESPMDDNEEEMGDDHHDDASSSGEGIAETEDESAYTWMVR